jgi:hypothetical protein
MDLWWTEWHLSRFVLWIFRFSLANHNSTNAPCSFIITLMNRKESTEPIWSRSASGFRFTVLLFLLV